MAADDSEPDQPPPQNDVAPISLPHKISDSSEKIDAAKDRDIALARVEWEKKMALIKAWEESEKIKAENKAYKRLSAVESWENTRKASIEAQLMKIEEKMEKKKAEYAEQMKNKIVGIHKEGEEKKQPLKQNEKNIASRLRKRQKNIVLQGSYQRLYSNASVVEMLRGYKNRFLSQICTLILVFVWYYIELGDEHFSVLFYV
ncbi:hypothetical protein Csa_000115 [Cucumis sativus]|uniref:Remorin C-terminal domain-containing protein n=1 Tax=Cucumis sativus TaxID=3659 RepID=A0A0A0KQX6_CUCSA|nr:hypothetical protein Csa_000115 [Cucumis sativus]